MKKPKEFVNRDLNTQLKFPVISWSSMNQFSYSKDDWYSQYVLGIRSEINPAMAAGIAIGERWASDPTFLSEVERPEIFEQNYSAVIGDIKITGHIDGLHLKKKKKLQELKTTVSKTKWTKDSVRSWGQLTMYTLFLYLHERIKPEDLEMELIYVPVSENGNFEFKQSGQAIVIPTERTTLDILNFIIEIKRVHKEMCQFIEQKKLSTH